jgi:hypothetical protein
MPEGLELAAKLMVPDELALATCSARYAYQGRPDCPPGISPDDAVEFEVLLAGFDREGHWQVGWTGWRGQGGWRTRAQGIVGCVMPA